MSSRYEVEESHNNKRHIEKVDCCSAQRQLSTGFFKLRLLVGHWLQPEVGAAAPPFRKAVATSAAFFARGD